MEGRRAGALARALLLGVFALTSLIAAAGASAAVGQPSVATRSFWGAPATSAFAAPATYPIQKVIVMDTGGSNTDTTDPAVRIRTLWHYQTGTLGYSDVSFNFLIDSHGRIYEGRAARPASAPYASGQSPTGEDAHGNGVAGAFITNYNSGTVGIALMGSFGQAEPTPQALGALEHLIAWIDDSHGLDPLAVTTYTNPVVGTHAVLPAISSLHDIDHTACTGFWCTLPQVRTDVARIISDASGSDLGISLSSAVGTATPTSPATVTVSAFTHSGFTGAVWFSGAGLPSGAVASFDPAGLDNLGSTALKFSPGTAASGTYPLTISVTSGLLTRSTTYDLTIQNTATPVLPAGRCVVPRVVGERLATARAVLRASHCAVGVVRVQYSPSWARGRVIAQRPRRGTVVKAGSRIALTVGLGRR